MKTARMLCSAEWPGIFKSWVVFQLNYFEELKQWTIENQLGYNFSELITFTKPMFIQEKLVTPILAQNTMELLLL
jgi:hypothetical protein